MKVLLTVIILAISMRPVQGQVSQSLSSSAQLFGVIDKADLAMTSCDFEKDANAEILFDKCEVSFNYRYEREINRHIRIKIFNDDAKNATNVKLRYFTGNHPESISDIQAETINLIGGAVEFSKVDKQQIFNQKINKSLSEIVFSFPNVKAGSIIEYCYKETASSFNIPDWYFQTTIPTRYSEISTEIPSILSYKSLAIVNQPFAKSTDQIKALANVPSLKPEPFTGAPKDNLDHIAYQLTNINGSGVYKSYADTWQKITDDLLSYDDFGGQLNRKLTGEADIITKAKLLKADRDKIAYIFEEVQKQMKWNNSTVWYTTAGVVDAWDKKTGNSAEINLILYHLLKKSGLNVFPMLVSTHNNGKVYPNYPNKSQFNKVVSYIPVDSTTYFVLDACNKYYTYNEIPVSLLSNFGLCIQPEAEKNYDLVFLEKSEPVLQTVNITANILPDGKMNGSAEINSYSYRRISALERYKADGEKKYVNYLRDKDNNLKITGLKLENTDVDTLPLKQHVDFTLMLAASDESYIYFTPNLFNRLKNNPLLSEKRLTDIDFEYRNNYVTTGIFTVPSGYKADVLPKDASLIMPDKGISFKRRIAERDGNITVSYIVDFKKSWYSKDNYPEIHEFFKKMYEMLNEQIVLKKS